MSETALILAAHGSRLASSNDEVRSLASALASELPGYMVRAAFLELTSPSIVDCATTLLNSGVNKLIVLPYFLAAGSHVSKDLPAIIEHLQSSYPDADISCTTHLGNSPLLLPALCALIEETI